MWWYSKVVIRVTAYRIKLSFLDRCLPLLCACCLLRALSHSYHGKLLI